MAFSVLRATGYHFSLLLVLDLQHMLQITIYHTGTSYYGCVWLAALDPSQASVIQIGPVWMPAQPFSRALAMQKRPAGLA